MIVNGEVQFWCGPVTQQSRCSGCHGLGQRRPQSACHAFNQRFLRVHSKTNNDEPVIVADVSLRIGCSGPPLKPTNSIPCGSRSRASFRETCKILGSDRTLAASRHCGAFSLVPPVVSSATHLPTVHEHICDGHIHIARIQMSRRASHHEMKRRFMSTNQQVI